MKTVKIFAFVLGLSMLASCDKEPVQSSDHTTVSGSAVKGYVGTAKVEVYAYQANGQRGALIASTFTDAQGNYSVSANYRGPAEVVVTQGQYLDEATGTAVSLQANELRAIVSLDQANKTAAVTALTTVAAGYVDANAATGMETAIAKSSQEVAKAFGLVDINLTNEVPADLSYGGSGKSMAQIKYGAVQAGLSQIIKDHNLSPQQLLTLVKDISLDFSDGVLDGKSGSAALQSSLTLTPNQALTGLNTAIESFMNSPRNKSGYTSGSVPVTVPRPRGN
jgi:hypothetical protein